MAAGSTMSLRSLDLLQQGCVPGQNFHQCARILPIRLEVRRHQDQLRIFLQGLDYRFAGLDAVFLGFFAFGQYDAVAILRVAADSHGQPNKIGPRQQLDGGVKAVHITVQYGAVVFLCIHRFIIIHIGEYSQVWYTVSSIFVTCRRPYD